jgi:soluble lytic murein transglycosylase-like protein
VPRTSPRGTRVAAIPPVLVSFFAERFVRPDSPRLLAPTTDNASFAGQLASARAAAPSNATPASARLALLPASAVRFTSTAPTAATIQATRPGGTAAPAARNAPSGAEPWLRTPARRALAAQIGQAAQSAGVEPELSLGVAIAESSLEPKAKSSDGLSHGTFQVTTATAADIRRRIRRGEVPRPRGGDDIALGVAHLRYLDDVFSDGRDLGADRAALSVSDNRERRLFVAAAYNAGEGRVAQAQARAEAAGLDPTRFANVRRYLPGQTQEYVRRVAAYSAPSAATARVLVA